MQENREIKRDGESLRTAIEQFAKCLGSGDFAAAMYDDSYSEDVSFSSEQAHLDFLDEKAALIKNALLAKFQEIVAPALNAKNAEVPGNLIRDDRNDGASYILREGADGVWIRVKNIDARIYPSDEGVVADLYPAHQPDTTPVASTYAFFAECEDEQG